MKKIFSFLLMIACLQTSYSQTVNLIQFSTGYTLPLGVENCGDNRLFIIQKTGQIIICDTVGSKLTTPYLDISGRILTTGSEQGLLGVAFNPNYKTNGFFYVNYINKSGNTQISRFKVSSTNPNKADTGSEKFILQIQQPYANHNGGCMRFGKDGFLYIGVGDGGSGGDPQNNAQNPNSLLGKILRINVNTSSAYTVPASNPFVDSANYKKEIWALGVRNPWRFSFDALSNALIIADVGQESWEEVNLQYAKSKGGENYGWRCYEGNHAYNTSGCLAQSAYQSPIYEYPHSSVTGDCSVTGGFVYRGKKYPSLYGKYFFTDYCSGIIRTLTLSGGIFTEKDVFTGTGYAYTSFGEDKNHELFLTNYVTGGIYRVASTVAVTAKAGESSASIALYPNPAQGNFSVKYVTGKAEECMVSVYTASGRQIFAEKKMAIVGDNVWKISVPTGTRGNCYVIVAAMSGGIVRQNIVLQ